MGLDKNNRKELNIFMKTLLAHLGFSAKGGGKGRVSPQKIERRRFEKEMRDQFMKLKEKGLGIRVFTL